MQNVGGVATVVVLATGVLVGCANERALGSSPEAASEDLGVRQSVTSTNSDGTWTADAKGPAIEMDVDTGYGRMYGKADFTGPTGATRKMGVCLLQVYTPQTECASVSDCGSAPWTLPTGGSRYCLAENGSGTKFCMFRPGDQGTYCAGSPALGGAAVSPGTYTTTPTAQVDFNGWMGVPNSQWVSEACFEGCGTISGSVSPMSTTAPVVQ